MEEQENGRIMASDVLKMLKTELIFMRVLVVILIVLLGVTHVWHIHKWSEFDTVVVDSGEAGGYANYIGGDNTGGVYNGEGDSQETQGQVEWDAG